MHPFFTRPVHLLAYVGSWLGLALLASFAVSYPDRSFVDTASLIVPIALTFAIVSLSSWNLCKAVPLSDTPLLRVVVSALAASVVGGWMFQGMSVVWTWILFDPRPDLEAVFPGGPLVVFTTGVVLYLLGIIFHYLLLAYELSIAAERRSLEAEVHARSSELKALRAQIDPHFLFNALNAIATLIQSEPERARDMTVQLADFFRASVAAGRKQLIPLAEEFDLVRTYLSIEQVRFGDRLRIEIGDNPSTDTIPVPPLLLQPLVENAIKHGISQLVGGGTIRIGSKRTEGALVISIANDVDPDGQKDLRTGTQFGIQAVRDRLKALAPGKAFLDVRQRGGTFEALMNIPTDLDG